jgi:hypothetical protein
MADHVRKQLLEVDGVLVWVDPISDGQNRSRLDAMLRDVASRGVSVSADCDVILKMGVKEVLYRTKHLGWGTDTHIYSTAQAFLEQFAQRLKSAGSRVLKQNRGKWRTRGMEGRAGFDVPIIWDADFLYGPRELSGEDTYVLCEINVSSVFPFPEQAPSEIARLVSARLRNPDILPL